MDVTKIGRQVLSWIHLAQDKDKYQIPVNTAMDVRVPWKAGNLLIRRRIFISKSLLHGGT